MKNPRMITRFVVLLRDTPDRQIWLAYNDGGRIGNATFAMAFRFISRHQANMALRNLPHKWPEAKIISTLVEEDSNQ